jgi:hypothetical protein
MLSMFRGSRIISRTIGQFEKTKRRLDKGIELCQRAIISNNSRRCAAEEWYRQVVDDVNIKNDILAADVQQAKTIKENINKFLGDGI